MCPTPDPEQDLMFVVICGIFCGMVLALALAANAVKPSQSVVPQEFPTEISRELGLPD